MGLYSFPLGYVEILPENAGIVYDGLLDPGSQINLMTGEKDYSLGLLVQVNVKMKFTGISNKELS